MTPNPKRNEAIRRILPLCGAIVCIGIWEANSHFRLFQIVAPSLSPSAFPSFFSIAGRSHALVCSAGFLKAVGVTITRTLSAFGIAAVLGTLLGLLAGRMRLIGALVNIPVEFFRNLPAIAAMPIFILFLGIGTPMKIALCVFGALFPIFIAARMGIQNISEDIHIAARFYGWRGWRLVFVVLLPAALPEIAAASQTALAISLILAIMGEMLIGGDGLGSMIVDAERTFNHLDLYALVLALGVVGCLLALGFRRAASRLIFWKTAIDWEHS
jgi:ABC-type nitrate/sulfonate/bicarbonate transport system permease component